MSKLLVVPLEALTDSALTDPERRVLFSLFSFRGRDTGLVWPSVEAIAERANIRDKTWISKLTKSLCEKGWLEKKRRGFSGRNSYQICFPDRLADDETEGDLASAGVVESEEKQGSADASLLGCQSKLDSGPKSAVNTEPDTFLGSQSKLDSEPNTFLGSQSNSYLGSQSKNKEQTTEQTSEQVTKKNNSKKTARGSRLPPDWRLPPEYAEDARQIDSRLVPAIPQIAAKFRDYWVAVPGAKGVKLDWRATWRNWVRREAERLPRVGPGGGPPAGRRPFQTAAEKRAARNAEIFDYDKATNF